MNEQTITSKNTSRVQLPYLHKTPLARAAILNSNVLDYGAGLSHELASEFVMRNGAEHYAWFDPYWNSTGGNCNALMNAPFDVVLCSNVLNVIDSDNALFNAVYHMLSLIKHDGKSGFGTVLLTVYEGDRSGFARPTRDGYQRNLRTSEYEAMINAKFRADYGTANTPLLCYRKGRVIICRYKMPCEMCELKSADVCRMCTDFDAAFACPYYDMTKYITQNLVSDYPSVERLIDFSDPFRNLRYAHDLYTAWKHCNDMTDYENIRNAFLQVKARDLGIDDSAYEEMPPRYPKIMA